MYENPAPAKYYWKKQNFLLIDATDKSKISSDRKRLFFALRLYPLSFFASTPFKDLLTKLYE